MSSSTMNVSCPKCLTTTPTYINAGYFNWKHPDSETSEPREFYCIWCGKKFEVQAKRSVVEVYPI